MALDKIDFNKAGLHSLVGELEGEMLDALWKKGDKLTCRELHRALSQKDVAYTTVAVTLDRMHDKGLVRRDVERGRGGLKYLYYPRYSKDQLANAMSKKFVNYLKKTFGTASIAYLKKNI